MLQVIYQKIDNFLIEDWGKEGRLNIYYRDFYRNA